MSRQEREQEMIESEHHFFTPDVRWTFDQFRYLRDEPDPVDLLWSKHKEIAYRLVRSKGDDLKETIDEAKLDRKRRRTILVRLEAALAYTRELEELPAEDFKKRYDSFFVERQAQRAEGIRWLEEESDKFAFFNLPDAVVDIATWSKKPVWSQEEAVALSFGKDPRRVNPAAFNDWQPQPRGLRSIFKERYAARCDDLRRAVAVRALKEPIKPVDFMSWAAKQWSGLPAEFTLHSANASGEEIHGGRLAKLYSIILGLMARRYPSFDGSEKKVPNSLREAVHEDLKDVGIDVSSKTVGTILVDALSWVSDQPDHPFVVRALKRKKPN